MIGRLALDHDSLNYERFLIIAELEERIADGEIIATNKNAEIAIWRALDINGKATGWSHVAVRYLEDQQL